jgi:mevalonate kinase
MTGTGYAPGKVILLGEHAVVHGQPALAAPVYPGVEVRSEPGEGRLRVPAWDVTARPGDGSSLGEALAAILKSMEMPMPPVDLTATFHVPAGAGLGSSAALSVAAARVLSLFRPGGLDEAALARVALAAETVFHGTPSGVDHAVVAQGGMSRFSRAEGLRRVVGQRKFILNIGHTGLQRDTKGRVARVSQLLAERPEDTRARFQAIGALVEKGVRAVEEGDLGTLGAAMDENQRHLDALEVSCSAIERLCALAREAGAVGAKLTGGGGGGCVIALAPGREQAVQDAWQKAGFQAFVTQVDP